MELQMKVNTEYTYDKVVRLYNEAFPRRGRIAFESLLKHIDTGEGELTAYYAEKTFVAFSYVCYFKDITYLFYFAVDPEFRNRGYGTTILKYLKMKYRDKKFILAAEALTGQKKGEAERERRIAFYEKNGFNKSNYIIKENKILYEVFHLTKPIGAEEYINIIRCILNKKEKKHFKLEVYKSDI
ncbi:MAG: GNAT family N-acetyltransferase [Bacilli bacterium]